MAKCSKEGENWKSHKEFFLENKIRRWVLWGKSLKLGLWKNMQFSSRLKVLQSHKETRFKETAVMRAGILLECCLTLWIWAVILKMNRDTWLKNLTLKYGILGSMLYQNNTSATKEYWLSMNICCIQIS